MSAIVRKLKRKLKPTDDVERCGLVLANGDTLSVQNEHPNRAGAFMISARDMLKYEPVGTWHTHPSASAAFSQEDYLGFCNWPQLTHYIIGIDGVRAYRVEDGIVVEVPCN